MIALTPKQRNAAGGLVTKAAKILAELAEARNIDHEARQAVNRARDELSLAETLIANQPDETFTVPTCGIACTETPAI